MSMADDSSGFMFQHPFAMGDYVEVKRYPGAVFRIVENTRDYDSTPISVIKFIGPRRGIPPRTKGGLRKNFRIKRLNVNPWDLVDANPMLVIAAVSEG